MTAQTAPAIAAPRTKSRSYGAVRKLLIVFGLILIWQFGPYLIGRERELIPFYPTLVALWEGTVSGRIPAATGVTLTMLLSALGIGAVLALLLTALATFSAFGRDLLDVLTAALNPLPAVALVPVAIFLFGFGTTGVLFVMVNATLWPMAVAWSSGFRSVNRTVLSVGRNLGLSGTKLFGSIYVMAALPAILTGFRQAWAFGWRTIIAVELVFGSQGNGGLGFFIGNARYLNNRADVYAGLLAIIIVGLAIERFILEPIERNTVRKWGMAE